MYQNVKDVYEAIERGLKTERQILQNQNAVGGGGETRQITYTKGRISGLEQALGLLNLLLDQYENEPQPSNAEEKESDALDFVHFMKQCRP